MKEMVVQKTKIACDGGAASSHPKVWLQIDPGTGKAVCPYCEQVFVLDPKAASAAH